MQKPCVQAINCTAYTGSCQPSPCIYDWNRQGGNSDALTIGADSSGANAFIGDIFETFRFIANDPPVRETLAVINSLILPYLQVSINTSALFSCNTTYFVYGTHFKNEALC